MSGGGKLPGKTAYDGRRRPMTRRSGFGVGGDLSGGEYRTEAVPSIVLTAESRVRVRFEIPRNSLGGGFAAFGGYFRAKGQIEVAIHDLKARYVLTTFPYPDWNKFGGLWRADAGALESTLHVTFSPAGNARLALWGTSCGIVRHRHFLNARPELLTNMHLFAPEANLIDEPGGVSVLAEASADGPTEDIILKACNRCQRFLPINTHNERNHLSFSNHCVAPHRRPCSHATFGHLTDSTGTRLRLDYGFQLECRFCKKFEVNAAHNPQRTESQMKEDAARRRGFELLIEALEGITPQLAYRRRTGGRELAEDVISLFGCECFNCGASLKEKAWHLDHTRPLALLWPLDEHATALCGDCNAEKRDRPPAEFYSPAKLKRLAELVSLPLETLRDPQPNGGVVRMLLRRLDWFFDEFLASPDMQKVRDGKLTADLLVKALQKTLSRCPGGPPVDLLKEYRGRTGRR